MHFQRSVTAASAMALATAALLTLPGCGNKPAKLALPMAVEDDGTRAEYVESHVDSPEMYARERDLLTRREELLTNWAIRQALDGRGAKVRAIAPPLQLTGDPNVDKGRTYSIILVADDLPAGQTFLKEYDVVVAPDPELVVIAPAESANSLLDTDLRFAEDALRQLRLDQVTVGADRAQAAKLKETLGATVTEAIAKARNNLTAFETNAAEEAAAVRKSESDTPRVVLNVLRLREQFGDAAHAERGRKTAATAATKRLRDATDQKATLTRDQEEVAAQTAAATTARTGAKDAVAAAQTALANATTDADRAKATADLEAAKTGLAEVEARLKNLQAQAKRLTDQLQRAEREITDSTERDTAAKAELTAATQAVTKASDALKAAEDQAKADDINLDQATAGVDLIRQRQRKEAADRRVERARADLAGLEALDRRRDVLASAADWYAVMVPFYEAEVQRLRELATATAGKGQYASDRAVSLTFRGEALAKIDQLRVEVIRKSALPDQRAGPDGQPGSSPGASAKGTTGAGGGGTTAAPDPDAALADLVRHLAAYESLLGQVRTVLLMTGQQIDAQSQIDYIENLTAAFAPLNAKLRLGMAKLEQAARNPDPPAAKGPGGAGGQSRVAAAAARGLLDQADPASRHLTLGDAMRAALAVVEKLPATKDRLKVADARRLANEVDAARAQVALLSESLQSASKPAQEAADGYEARFAKLIKDGDMAVFRFNVLRGVVRTTGYILADDAAELLYGRGFSDRFYILQVTLRNPQADKPILVYGNTMRFVVRMNSRNPAVRQEDGLPQSRNWWGLVQPLDYSSVLRMVIQEHEESWQRTLVRALELTGVGLGAGTAFTSSIDFARGVAVFTGVATPAIRELLEADLRRYRQNFEQTGLNPIEEIPAQGSLTRHVFLPKGPIYGSYAYDVSVATRLPSTPRTGLADGAEDFGRRALVPVYIHDIRREDVYVEGKRILASDPLTSVSR